ncbi:MULTISPECIES: YjiH family protein [unclassified Nocardiopsis]|uniref:YjiH family protein n=1 Tax=unclassified Nocardiopsis TaxID=2649073 RepID=UPI00066D6756|nr:MULTISPECIES: YjiH family protein [unclassified Nocardiopsis]MBQ1082037.1 YjiH family protein [Nocardiopsis sp. B62]
MSDNATASKAAGTWRLVVYSGIGIFMFFVPVTFEGRNAIPLDHLVTLLQTALGPALPYVIWLLIAAGTVVPFVTGTWRHSRVKLVFALLNIVGLAVASMVILDVGPDWFMGEDLAPFLFNAVAVNVGLLVPVGAIFLAMLVGYGLMEFVGVLLQRVMRPVWRTPGRSAVDAAASFVGSYSLGLLITDRVYQSGRYTGREAAIIAIGFSTVSVTFMVVIANTLDLMGIWLTYFFLTFFVTYAVTAILVRVPPLSRIPDDHFPGATPQPEEEVTGNRLGHAWKEARGALLAAPSLPRNVWVNFADGVRMSMSILPSIMSVGTIGLVVAHSTPVFDLLAYVFVPFTWVVGLSDPMLAAKALSVGIAEVFLPATVAAGSEDLVLRLVVGVVSVSSIVFFSALVPCVLATRIPLTVGQLVVIWFQRVILSVLIAGPLAYLLVGL